MNDRSATLMTSPARTAVRRSRRPPGREWRVLAWLFRHPLFLLHPALAVTLLVVLGPVTTVAGYATLAVAVLAWWRGHPATFDRHVGPHVRATWRRWTTYRGRRWASLLSDCGLTREHRHNGETLVPRVMRVRSSTPTIDTLLVRMVRGQDLTHWQEHAPVLAEALIAHRVAVSRARPGVVALVVERELPFDCVIPAPDIPASPDEVDLSALEIGDNEHGEAFVISVVRGHRVVIGNTGSGKGSVMWGTLRACGPCIRDGVVRVHMIDLKGGVETEQGAPLFTRYATTPDDALSLLTDFRDAMKARQEWMRDNGLRSCTPSVETPVEMLMVDEMAMLTAYADRAVTREALRLLAEIMTQGRASLFTVQGYLQEPTKDVLDVRELFTQRICLAVTAASHVDMALGDGARERGALADEIPCDARHAGIGFVIDAGSRLPVRFRAAYVRDEDIAELVARCTPRDADVIDLYPDHDGDQDGNGSVWGAS